MGKKKKVAGNAPASAKETKRPTDSGLSSDRNVAAHGREDQQVPLSQDSWRSYRNDATNLSQTANYLNEQNSPNAQYPDGSQWQFNQWLQLNSNAQHIAAHQNLQQSIPLPPQFPPVQQLNPFAESFQPNSLTTPTWPTRGNQKVHKTSRAINKDSKKHAQPDRPDTPPASTRSHRHALRSRGPPSPSASIKDVPFPSIEHQPRQSSSIPTNINSYSLVKSSIRSGTREDSHTPPPVPVPVVTQAYLAQASLPPSKLTVPQRLLIVLDLNGTLLKRTNRGFNFHLRPGITMLLDYLLANHTVMIYSSARPENVVGMVSKIFTDSERQSLAAIWARDKLDLTPKQYNSKVQVYKKLEKIWNDKKIQKTAQHGQPWSQNNTVLVDDNHLKGAAQPYNLLRVEEFTRDQPFLYSSSKTVGQINAIEAWRLEQEQIVQNLQAKLEELRWTEDVSKLIRQWHRNAKSDAFKETTLEPEQAREQIQLPTPQTLRSDSTDDDQSEGGVVHNDVDIDQLARDVENQLLGLDPGVVHGRSVSPIDEYVFKELLRGSVDSDKSA